MTFFVLMENFTFSVRGCHPTQTHPILRVNGFLWLKIAAVPLLPGTSTAACCAKMMTEFDALRQ